MIHQFSTDKTLIQTKPLNETDKQEIITEIKLRLSLAPWRGFLILNGACNEGISVAGRMDPQIWWSTTEMSTWMLWVIIAQKQEENNIQLWSSLLQSLHIQRDGTSIYLRNELWNTLHKLEKQKVSEFSHILRQHFSINTESLHPWGTKINETTIYKQMKLMTEQTEDQHEQI